VLINKAILMQSLMNAPQPVKKFHSGQTEGEVIFHYKVNGL